MLNKELQELLKQYPDDREVFFDYETIRMNLEINLRAQTNEVFEYLDGKIIITNKIEKKY